MAKPYDATKEHAPIKKSPATDTKGRHPNKGKPKPAGKTVRSYEPNSFD